MRLSSTRRVSSQPAWLLNWPRRDIRLDTLTQNITRRCRGGSEDARTDPGIRRHTSPHRRRRLCAACRYSGGERTRSGPGHPSMKVRYHDRAVAQPSDRQLRAGEREPRTPPRCQLYTELHPGAVMDRCLLPLAVLALLLGLWGRSSATAQVAVIPRPAHIRLTQGGFPLTPQTSIVATTETERIGAMLAQWLGADTGVVPSVLTPSSPPRMFQIALRLLGTDRMPQEGYRLRVLPHRIHLESPLSGRAGLRLPDSPPIADASSEAAGCCPS